MKRTLLVGSGTTGVVVITDLFGAIYRKEAGTSDPATYTLDPVLAERLLNAPAVVSGAAALGYTTAVIPVKEPTLPTETWSPVHGVRIDP